VFCSTKGIFQNTHFQKNFKIHFSVIKFQKRFFQKQKFSQKYGIFFKKLLCEKILILFAKKNSV
jgi:hypothetical protein